MNDQNNSNPKAFICHAGEDDEIATKLGAELRKNGIVAWVDDWEILPGDILIDKVFPEIDKCDAFIIILSKDSIDKPWVKEELNAALVKRIEEKTKLIPIRIDDCEVPLILKATAWETINPRENIKGQIEPLLTSIFNKTIKPRLGNIPERFQDAEKVDDLDIVETAALKCVLTLYENQGEEHIWGDQIREETGYSPSQVNDAEEILHNRGFLLVDRSAANPDFKFSFVKASKFAYIQYAPQFFGRDTESEMKSVLSYIVSSNRLVSGEEIAGATGLTYRQINHYVDYYAGYELVRADRPHGTAPYSFGHVEARAEGRREASKF